MAGPLRPTPRGLFLHIRATPGASRNEITGLAEVEGELSLAVKVTAIAEKGKANEAVVKLLAKTSGLSKSSFTLVTGETSRNKMFAVAGDVSTLEKAIRTLTDKS